MPEHHQTPEHRRVLHRLGRELLISQVFHFLLQSLYNLSQRVRVTAHLRQLLLNSV